MEVDLFAYVDAVSVHDATGRFLRASRPALRDLGFPADGLVGLAWQDLIHEADLETFQTGLDEVNTGAGVVITYRNLDGAWMESTLRPYEHGFVATTRRINHRAPAESFVGWLGQAEEPPVHLVA